MEKTYKRKTGIKNDGSTSYLKLGLVQNGHFYIRYKTNSQKNEAEELKKLTDYLPFLF